MRGIPKCVQLVGEVRTFIGINARFSDVATLKTKILGSSAAFTRHLDHNHSNKYNGHYPAMACSSAKAREMGPLTKGTINVLLRPAGSHQGGDVLSIAGPFPKKKQDILVRPEPARRRSRLLLGGAVVRFGGQSLFRRYSVWQDFSPQDERRLRPRRGI